VPEAEFTIDTESGEFRLHIHGVAGPACEDVAKLVKDLAGTPGIESKTAEYRLKPRVRPRMEVRARSQGR
jgi:hypothetical protein